MNLTENTREAAKTVKDLRKQVAGEFAEIETMSNLLQRSVKQATEKTVKQIRKGRVSIADTLSSILKDIGSHLGERLINKQINRLSSALSAKLDLGALLKKSLAGTIAQSGPIAGAASRSARIPHYHLGGIAGLKPDEIFAVLRKGEEVIPQSDPRHRYNSGGGQTRVSVDARGADPAAIARLQAILPELRQLASSDVVTAIHRRQRRQDW